MLNLVYFWLTNGKNERARREIDNALERVPQEEREAGTAVDEGAWSADAEMAAFQQAAAASSSLR